eukprot:TRINITY_DN769_c0_g3_i2.p1 TRINITY_DN769_c0_g3~~TRINITY_DN769_c0_g3_i2.p1  ORF type:complete len:156 (+),score=27.38 TRINITY_DN769_c0_g3_i2:39-506(+)
MRVLWCLLLTQVGHALGETCINENTTIVVQEGCVHGCCTGGKCGTYAECNLPYLFAGLAAVLGVCCCIAVACLCNSKRKPEDEMPSPQVGYACSPRSSVVFKPPQRQMQSITPPPPPTLQPVQSADVRDVQSAADVHVAVEISDADEPLPPHAQD